ncbi:hypothetical protein Leryth_021981 [Lithospermum erythrorhizon]|nr:hypothetical protein Leryth_021981 [Lithospermum erythrorhizon]
MLISFCIVGHPPNIFIITASFIFLDISMSCNEFYYSHFEIPKMTTTQQPSRDNNIVDFRAPPPSPVASGRRSMVANDEVLTEFLETSLKVPSLTLPDRAFPRQTSSQTPPTLDFLELTPIFESGKSKNIIDSIAKVGCFQVINHGISHDLVRCVLGSGQGIFRISPEKRKSVARSEETEFGFEESHEEDDEVYQEFVWSNDEKLKRNMDAVWPHEYSNFRENMGKLLPHIENVAESILQFLRSNKSTNNYETNGARELDGTHFTGPVCYLQKHSSQKVIIEEQRENSLRHDVIRTLIRGSEFPHALSLHLCNGCEEFHVYSKKGWSSFQPDKGAIVITLGDKLQVWSSGQYKHVIGRAVFKGITSEDNISLTFLYSPPYIDNMGLKKSERYFSIYQQIICFILISFVYRLWTWICQMF